MEGCVSKAGQPRPWCVWRSCIERRSRRSYSWRFVGFHHTHSLGSTGVIYANTDTLVLGGKSFFQSKVGFVCDNVLNFEVSLMCRYSVREYMLNIRSL